MVWFLGASIKDVSIMVSTELRVFVTHLSTFLLSLVDEFSEG